MIRRAQHTAELHSPHLSRFSRARLGIRRRVRRRVLAALEWYRVAVRKQPMLSVIVDACDDQAVFVGACLSSLAQQEVSDVEIVLAPHGRADTICRIFARHAAHDSRLRVLGGSADRAAARNAGIVGAKGRYVAFITVSDRAGVKGYARLVDSLESSQSDFAVGIMQVPNGVPNGCHLDHTALQARATSLTAVPTAVSDNFVGNRVLRRSFCRKSPVRFAAAERLRDEFAMTQAYVAASRIDIVPVVVSFHQNRGDGLAVGAKVARMPTVQHWLDECAGIAGILSALGDEQVLDAWLRSFFACSAPPYIDDVECATDDQWGALQGALETYMQQISEPSLLQVSVANRVKAWLVAHGRRKEVEDLVAAQWFESGNAPTYVTGGEVFACLPSCEGQDIQAQEQLVPARLYARNERETPLVTSLRRLRWLGPTELELEVWAYIKGVDLSGIAPACQMSLVEGSGETIGDLDVEPSTDASINRFAADRYQDYRRGVFTVRIDAKNLAAVSKTLLSSKQLWSLHVRMEAGGVVRSSTISHVQLRESAGIAAGVNVGGIKINTRQADGQQFAIDCAPADATLRWVETNGRVVRGSLDAGEDARLIAVRARCGAVEAHGPSAQTVGGTSFELELPEPPRGPDPNVPERWTLRLLDEVRGEIQLAWPEGETAAWLGAFDGQPIAAVRSPYANVSVEEVAGRLCVDDISVDDAHICVEARWLGSASAGGLRLASDRLTILPDTVEDDGKTVRAFFPTVHDTLEIPDTPLYSGLYRLVHQQDASDEVSAALASDALLSQMPRTRLTDRFRFDLQRTTGRALGIRVSPPLTDATLSSYGQKKMQEAAENAAVTPNHEAVYFQSYGGHVASDSPLAIHQELWRRGTNLTLYWGVADYATLLPAGALPVLLKSPQWYETITSVKYLVNNVDFDRWFNKKPHQKFLQTFHGYPSKSMGIRMWEAKNLTPRRIRAELQRTSFDWDLVVTPTPEMNEYYRREYAYEGPIFDRGYPRDDVLVSADAPRIRQRTRELLEIEENQTVVLYAPTWRDDVALNFRSAPVVSHLDLEEASAFLGPEYVLLMRGHRFHVRRNRLMGAGARLVDVTAYPEVNDLILAADAAILDYSSLRFDFALTNKPMIFLVPDLDSYTGGARGFLYDFRDTAPGPLLNTAEEAVTAVKRLDEVGLAHRDEYERFNRRFNSHQDGHAAARLTDVFFADGVQ